MRLYHNMASINAFKSYTKSLDKQASCMNKLNTGSRINRAKDNPNLLGKSEAMKIQIRGLQMSQRNVQDGVSMMQNIDGALSSVNEYLNRIRELTVQAGGITDDEDKNSIANEIDEMVNGIKSVVHGSEFNGVNIIANLNVTDNSKPEINKILSGANSWDTIKIPTYNLDPNNIKDNAGNNLVGIGKEIRRDNIGSALNTIDFSTEMVAAIRSKYGGICNRLEVAYDINGELGDTIQNADSSVGDADVAFEMMNLAKYNVLVDSSLSIMRQTNNFPQDVLRILENLK